MPPFQSRSITANPISTHLRKHPFLFFGLPFITLTVLSSFALQSFTQTRYDYQSTKHTIMSQEEALRMDRNRKKVDLREEYYRLSGPSENSSNSTALDADQVDTRTEIVNETGLANEPTETGGEKRRKKKFSMTPLSQDELENVRVPRPDGMPEWGFVAGVEEAPVKGRRITDRWV